MTERKISLPTAKLASEKGFVDGSKYYYFESVYGEDTQLRDYGLVYNKVDGQFEDVYEAPTQSILQKWLREVYDIKFFVFVRGKEGWVYSWSYHLNDFSKTIFKSYEDALEEALFESLKLIK